MGGVLERNTEELDTNPWLSLSNIMDGLDIPDEMTKKDTL